MEYAGFTQSGMARELDWDASRVSRLLSGKRGGSGYDIAAFLAVCRVHGPEYERLMALTTDRARVGWHQQHGARLPPQLRTLIDHENRAMDIREFEFNLVPGLLQTTEYARALIEEAGTLPEDEIEERVRARHNRHMMISHKRAPQFTFFVHEFALHLPVGGKMVMSDQLHELLRMQVRPNVSLRIVPAAKGGHAAINGSFRLMEFKEIKPIVYLESETSSLFLEAPIEIDAYRTILVALEDTALDEGQSRELIADLAVTLYAD